MVTTSSGCSGTYRGQALVRREVDSSSVRLDVTEGERGDIVRPEDGAVSGLTKPRPFFSLLDASTGDSKRIGETAVETIKGDFAVVFIVASISNSSLTSFTFV